MFPPQKILELPVKWSLCSKVLFWTSLRTTQIGVESFLSQESPPAWTQEAYRPPCNEYSSPNWVPPHPDLAGGGTLPGYPWQGIPQQGTPWQCTPWQGTPSRVPPGRVPSPGWTWQGTPPGVCPMTFWVMLQSIMGYGYSPCGQTDGRTDMCQNITFPLYYVRGR